MEKARLLCIPVVEGLGPFPLELVVLEEARVAISLGLKDSLAFKLAVVKLADVGVFVLES